MESKEMLGALLSLIRAAFGQDAEIADGIDWEKLYFYASKHHVANIVCYALDRLKISPGNNVYDAFKTEQMKAIRTDMLQEREINVILKEYEEQNIAAVALKGFVLKDMYPSRDMRVMGDLDLLLKKEDIPVPPKTAEWLLVTYRGQGLGWCKHLGNRLNNYYPKEWRIRMTIE